MARTGAKHYFVPKCKVFSDPVSNNLEESPRINEENKISPLLIATTRQIESEGSSSMLPVDFCFIYEVITHMGGAHSPN
jgi:hypothetical protein